MVVYQDFLLECDFERHFQFEVSLKFVQSKHAEGDSAVVTGLEKVNHHPNSQER